MNLHCVNPPKKTACYHPHPPPTFIIITHYLLLSPKADTYFTVPRRVEG